MALNDLTPVTRMESILNGDDIEPVTREEYFVQKAAAGGGGGGGVPTEIYFTKVGEFSLAGGIGAGEFKEATPSIYVANDALRTRIVANELKIVALHVVQRTTSATNVFPIVWHTHTSLQPYFSVMSSTGNITPNTFKFYNPTQNSTTTSIYFDVYACIANAAVSPA